ncbi:MAG: hypothetical protein ABI432_18565 [Flavobacteriales bacterium]
MEFLTSLKGLRIGLLIFAPIVAPPVFSQCAGANLLTNGDFVSPEGEAILAPGWSGINTPDVNDQNGPLNSSTGYVWVGTPLASPTGGTWQNMTHSEAVEQTVPTMIDESYIICFDYARQGIVGDFDYSGPFGIRVSVNGALVYTTPLDYSGYSWEHACFSFVANDPLSTFTFGGTNGVDTNDCYGAIDGVCMTTGVFTGLGSSAVQPPMVFLPNPASGATRIATGAAIERVIATNAVGRSFMLPTDGQWIDLGQLSQGIYSVQCWGARTDPLCGRLVIVE